MLFFNNEKKDCTGCSACASVCPVKCISMIRDKEGFLYPVASEHCIKCGRCSEVCPQNNSSAKIFNNTQSAYMAVTKDKNVWRRSASGGAFSEICRTWGDDTTYIFGAEWNGLQVRHKGYVGIDNISSLCKSKYIASNIDNIFLEVKDALRSGVKVVFCGTPCQVAGLKCFLGKDYSNLLLIDLICHGVGSPIVFQKCISILEKQFNGRILEYEFRAKRKAFETDYLTRIKLFDGRELFCVEDPYIQLFWKQKCLRPSCGGNCKYRDGQRYGDLTIADFKGLYELYPEKRSEKYNYSTIVSNTEKGKAVIEQLHKKMIIKEVDIEVIKKYNPLFCKQTPLCDTRNTFFASFEQDGEEAITECTTPAKEYKRSKKRLLYDCLPVWVRKMLIKAYER